MFTSFSASGLVIIKKIGKQLQAERWITLLAVERERERERANDPLIKMNGILEPGKKMVGLCKELYHVFVLLFLCNRKKLFYFSFGNIAHQNPLETCVVHA